MNVLQAQAKIIGYEFNPKNDLNCLYVLVKLYDFPQRHLTAFADFIETILEPKEVTVSDEDNTIEFVFKHRAADETFENFSKQDAHTLLSAYIEAIEKLLVQYNRLLEIRDNFEILMSIDNPISLKEGNHGKEIKR